MNKNNQDLFDILEIAKSLGADETEVYSTDFYSLESRIEKNQLHISSSSSGTQVGIRIIKDHRLGFVTLNSLKLKDINLALKEGIEIAKNSPPDKFHCFSKPDKIIPVKELYDKTIENTDVKYPIDMCNTMISKTKAKDKRLSIDGGGFEIHRGSNRLVNTNSVDLQYDMSLFIYSLFEFAVDKKEVGSFQIAVDAVTARRNVNIDKVINEGAQKALSILGAKKIPKSFRGKVLLSPETAGDLILDPIIASINSNNVQKGTSYFKNKLNKKVAPIFLSLDDDPTIPGKLGSAPFDREGVPKRKISIIDNGILKNFLYNSYTAKKAKRKSTGHAAGGAGTTPGISISNVFIKPGRRPKQKILSEIIEGLLVTRFSGNLDVITGDFSGLAKGAFYIKNGEIQFPVKGVMIAGNAYEALLNLVEVSSDVESIINVNLPYMLLDNISVTSA